jgi:hypothetical protein
MPSSPDPAERRRRRALLRAAHPDLGGDPEEFIRVLAELDHGGTAARGPAGEVRFVRRPRGLARIPAWWRRRRRPPRVV